MDTDDRTSRESSMGDRTTDERPAGHGARTTGRSAALASRYTLGAVLGKGGMGEVIDAHDAQIGRAYSAPPMSVPHLDTRWINDEQELLFGPYAGFTTKFLKTGSWLDLLGSIGIHNIRPVMSAGLENMDLTKYLVGQALLSHEERVDLLQRYMPLARDEDWEVQVAGLRVQIIKADGHGGGELRFGTEVVTSTDGTISALLVASPGASTAVSIMLDLLARCFPDQWTSDAWRSRLARLIPSAAGPLK